MSEIGGGINSEPAASEAKTPIVAPAKVKETEQKPHEGLFSKLKRIATFSGSIINEVQNAPDRLNPLSTNSPRPLEPQPEINQTTPTAPSPEKV